MLRTAEQADPAPGTDPGTTADRRPTSARLTVQRGMFAGPSALVPHDLYAEVLSGTARRERDRVLLTAGTHVTTNTYWGRLHATYWQRWTAVPEVRVELKASGRGRVWLMASDTNKVARAVDVAEAGSEGADVVLTGSVDRFVDGGGMWVEMATETDEMTVSDVRWSVAHPEPLRPTSITICTFNRVEDCLNTLQALLDDPFARGCVRYVRVVDQGTDPLQSRDRFADIADAFGEQLRYQRQPNLGGAGGFTRGLFEATAGEVADDHDVLLMDDDVLLDPEIVV
ncbi:MAG: glycosyltransferase, partial [Pseudonocardia sp.]|nr:glycosyltransferase [Pseudonocardia sp.]